MAAVLFSPKAFTAFSRWPKKDNRWKICLVGGKENRDRHHIQKLHSLHKRGGLPAAPFFSAEQSARSVAPVNPNRVALFPRSIPAT
jgi:hypothetical protein